MISINPITLMKKFLSILAATLFAGSMVAGNVTFSGEDFTGGTANTGSAFTVTKSGVTVSSDKAYGTGSELRIYQGGKLTVTASEKITKISAEFGQNTKMTFDDATPNNKTWSVEATKQIRITKLTVTIDGEGGDDPGEQPGDNPGDIEVKDCASAAQAALSVSANNEFYNNGAEYTIQGYVTAIQTEYNDNFNNLSFWMADEKGGGKVLQAYRCTPEAANKLPEVNDLVKVTGKLTKYGSTPEFAQGCTCVILEKGEAPVVEPAENLGKKTIAEFLELKNEKDTCILTGIVSNIVNTTYGNFDLVEIDNEEVLVYVYGLLTAEGANKQFEKLGVNEGDTLTVKAIYSEYNGKPQVKNAIFVSVKKKPAEIIDIEITEGLRYIDAVENYGWWQIYGENDTYYITLSNNNEISEAPGTYNVADLDAEYSFIEVLETEKDIAFVDGSITLDIDEEGNVTVEGSLTGSDGNIYNIHLAFSIPEVENIVEVTIDNGELDESNADANIYGVIGTSEDGIYVQLYLYTENIVGEFTEDDIFDDYCGIAIGEDMFDIYSATISISLSNNIYTVVADLLAFNNTLYQVTMIIAGGTGVENNTINAKAGKSIHNGTIFLEKNGVRYNALGQKVR